MESAGDDGRMSSPPQGEPPVRRAELRRVWRELTRPGTEPVSIPQAFPSWILWGVLGGLVGALDAVWEPDLLQPRGLELALIPFGLALRAAVRNRWWALLAGVVAAWAVASAAVAVSPDGMWAPGRAFIAVVLAGISGGLVHAVVTRGRLRATTMPP
jgi:hypothetical protein